MGSALGSIWGASIGCGFGSIFDQAHATKRVLVYWAATMALVGPFFSLIIGAAVFPYDSAVQVIIAGGFGAVVGMLFGFLIGTIQLKRLRRRSQAPHLGASIGCGFGSIIDQEHATKRVVVYWGAAMALVGSFFGFIIGEAVFQYDSAVQVIIACGSGAAAGMLFGFLIGMIQLKRLRRRSQAPHLGSMLEP